MNLDEQYLAARGWRQSALCNDPIWWIDPMAVCFCYYTLTEALALQRKRDAAGPRDGWRAGR